MQLNRKTFYDQYRAKLDIDSRISKSEVKAIDLFLDYTGQYFDWFTLEQWAYIFATVFHETAHTFEPVREAFNKSEDWRKANLRYWPHYGRGYVQITWKRNYDLFTRLVKEHLNIRIKGMDDFMHPNIAFFTLIYGFKNGSFTGARIDKYITISKKDYINARRCINGSDKAEKIADHAEEFERILRLCIKNE